MAMAVLKKCVDKSSNKLFIITDLVTLCLTEAICNKIQIQDYKVWALGPRFRRIRGNRILSELCR